MVVSGGGTSLGSTLHPPALALELLILDLLQASGPPQTTGSVFAKSNLTGLEALGQCLRK